MELEMEIEIINIIDTTTENGELQTEYADGTKKWYLNGQLHRTDGPAADYADGDKFWYLNGELHRIGGPAVEYADGRAKLWYLNGELHRTDGPAADYADGRQEWYVNGKQFTDMKLFFKAVMR